MVLCALALSLAVDRAQRRAAGAQRLIGLVAGAISASVAGSKSSKSITCGSVDGAGGGFGVSSGARHGLVGRLVELGEVQVETRARARRRLRCVQAGGSSGASGHQHRLVDAGRRRSRRRSRAGSVGAVRRRPARAGCSRLERRGRSWPDWSWPKRVDEGERRDRRGRRAVGIDHFLGHRIEQQQFAVGREVEASSSCVPGLRNTSSSISARVPGAGHCASMRASALR